MKIFLKLNFLFLVFIFSYTLSKGQAILSLGSDGLIGFPDTVAPDSYASFSAFIKNSGNQPYSGNISINYSVDAVIQFTSMHSGYYPNINPNDSSFVNISNFFFDSTIFTPNAAHVVVVWTSSGGKAQPGDSTTVTVYVTGSTVVSPPVGIIDNKNIYSFSCYPNPSGGNIDIEMNLPESDIQAVNFILFNNIGQKVFEKECYVNSNSFKESVYIDKESEQHYYLVLYKKEMILFREKIIIIK